MTVAYGTLQPHTGGSLSRRELHATEIRPEVAQGPVPTHLLEMEDEEPITLIRRAVAPKPAPFAGMSPEERREKARKGGLAKAAKIQASERFPLRPCPDCGSSTKGKGVNSKGDQTRHCSHCRRGYIVQADGSLKRMEGRQVKEVPCPECGSSSKNKGSAAGGGAWRRCLSCGKNWRMSPPPERPTISCPPCSRCQGRMVANGITHQGWQIYKCKGCRRSSRGEMVSEERRKQE